MAKPPLILASQSMARRKMLENAGLFFSLIPAALDEEAVIEKMTQQKILAPAIALELSEQKALAVAKSNPAALVIGADQILEFEGRIITKAGNVDEAKGKLRMLKGKSHKLVSAVSVAQGEEVLWQSIDEAVLSMHDFDDDFLEAYCRRAGEGLSRAVGAYELESFGTWLFSGVQGNYFTILGLPLLPLLGYLKDNHGFSP